MTVMLQHGSFLTYSLTFWLWCNGLNIWNNSSHCKLLVDKECISSHLKALICRYFCFCLYGNISTYLFVMTGPAVQWRGNIVILCNIMHPDSISVWTCGLKLHGHYSNIQVLKVETVTSGLSIISYSASVCSALNICSAAVYVVGLLN